MLLALWESLRPAQWAKNLFVLAPLVFAGLAFDPTAVRRSLLAFAVFCAAASAVYLLNDIRDREEDRQHPRKSKRPIAAGRLSVRVAAVACAVLGVAAAAGAITLGRGFTALLATYLGLNVLYSLGLKRVVILDVMVVSLGFVLRVLAGGQAIDVDVSSWLDLCTFFLALFLTFSKRRHEVLLLSENASQQRQVLSHYSVDFLDQMINVVTASTVVAYSLYVISPETVDRVGSQALLITVPLVLFGIFRYLYLVYQRHSDKNPTELIFSDGPLLVDLVLWTIAVVAILYF